MDFVTPNYAQRRMLTAIAIAHLKLKAAKLSTHSRLATYAHTCKHTQRTVMYS